ncbi:MAG: bifunctional oligoribonuclease/PAP phosphatase NrnA [Halanaerobiales bacterium]|nr:bifunctional oligoribonuclease/PAP phosphatase NrnA [Halanaerobiales bacterium]
MKRGKMTVKTNLLENISEYIKENNDYLIIGHIDPDGDAIGSIMAFKFLLDRLGKNSLLLLHSDIIKEYDILFNYLDKDEYYIPGNSIDFDKLSNYKNAVVLDTATAERLGNYKKILNTHYIINIDHHHDNTKYGNLNYINSKDPAVGKIIFDIAKLFNLKPDGKLGTAIALAVLADTGSLKYPNSNSDTFRLIADLKELDIDVVEINRFLQSYPSLEYLKMLAKGLKNIKMSKDKKVAWLTLSKEEINELDIDEKDIKNLVNYPKDIRGVEVGISFVERKTDFVDISFRSHSYVDVSKIAHKFNGGGHPRASGTKVHGDFNQVVKDVISEVKLNV